MSRSIIIQKPVLVIVEGKFDSALLQWRLKRLKLESRIEVHDLGGVGELKVEKFKAYRNATGFDQVRSLGIVRDADNSRGSAIQSVKAVLVGAQLLNSKIKEGFEKIACQTGEYLRWQLREAVGMNVRKICILIMPPDRAEGSAEDWIWAAIEGKKDCVGECIVRLSECIRGCCVSDLNGKQLLNVWSWVLYKGSAINKVEKWDFLQKEMCVVDSFLRDLCDW